MGTCKSTCIYQNNPQESNQIVVDSPQTPLPQPQVQQLLPSTGDPSQQQKIVFSPTTKRTFKKSRFYLQQNKEQGCESTNDYLIPPQNSTKIYSKTFIIPKINKRQMRKKSYEHDWIDETVISNTEKMSIININRNKQNNICNKQSIHFLIVGRKQPLLLSKNYKDELYDQLVSLSKQKKTPLFISQEIMYEDGAYYKGQWKNQQKQGKGIYMWPGGANYEGNWVNNSIQGKGKVKYSNGNTYQGEFKSNRAEGFGQFFSKDGSIYKGNWKNGLQQGQGCLVFQNGDKFQGNWKAGKKHGYGQLIFKDGSYYKGQFIDNQIQGQGEYNWEGTKKYKGMWKHNQMHGKGIIQWNNGDRYQGYFSHNKMHGKGFFYDKIGTIFSGTWENGRKNGIFTQTKSNGQIIKGLWGFNKLIRKIESTSSIVDEQDISLSDQQATV